VRRGLVVVSLVLFLGGLGVLYGLVPAAAEEAVGAYQYVAVALLTGATVLLIATAATARPPQP
jgi:ABC-type transport system involved in multi-copper enzyme maturation permease subunit